MNDDLRDRLRAARPTSALVDEQAFDGVLLDRVRQQMIEPRRTLTRTFATPVVVGTAAVATAAVLLVGLPGHVAGPPSAAAITQQTLHWLDPAPGSILHVRSVENQGGRTTTREIWQSGDDASQEREVIGGDSSYEIAGDGIYDAATNTVYATGSPAAAKEAGVRLARQGPDGPRTGGDPVIEKVRVLLGKGVMTVSGPEQHDGVDSWAVSLSATAGRPVWTLWVAVADGRPIELQDPGRDASEAPQDITWPVYEVLPGDAATRDLLTVAGAHPSATVVLDPARVAAEQQLVADKP